MKDTERRIDDLIIENMAAAKDTVMSVFQTRNVRDLEGWERLLAAMRGLPMEAMDDIGATIIKKAFMVFGCDPTTERGRHDMKPFQDIVALALQDAMTLLMQTMQRTDRAAEVLRSGRGNLLK